VKSPAILILTTARGWMRSLTNAFRQEWILWKERGGI